MQYFFNRWDYLCKIYFFLQDRSKRFFFCKTSKLVLEVLRPKLTWISFRVCILDSNIFIVFFVLRILFVALYLVLNILFFKPFCFFFLAAGFICYYLSYKIHFCQIYFCVLNYTVKSYTVHFVLNDPFWIIQWVFNLINHHLKLDISKCGPVILST